MKTSKIKSAYYCQSCGYSSAKWLGKCPSCHSWNTFVEEITSKESVTAGDWRVGQKNGLSKPKKLEEIAYQIETRIETQQQELNRVLGGGLVPGSVTLIGGEPGIGKSTLLLQIAMSLRHMNVLYVSGEESESQIKLRAERLQSVLTNAENKVYILSETSTQHIFKQVEIIEPELLIVDSIQTMQSAFIESTPGSVSQVRECAAEFIKYAKETNVPVILIGHITKEGALAGPKVLEHMVDTVLQFEGDRHMVYRILRTTKNRFGSTSELGIYEMQHAGLREVTNPSEILLSQREGDLSGVGIGAMIEGNRPLLIEVQSLVSVSTYGTPQRSCTGFDAKRLQMLLAVLEKRAGFRLGAQDVFLNITGGLRVEDPALDLAVCMSILSSYEDIAIPHLTCFAAEVGLGGEIRAVQKPEMRISEAQKLGFKEIYVSKFALKGIDTKRMGIAVHAVAHLDEVISGVFA